jgi:hypothetical protein
MRRAWVSVNSLQSLFFYSCALVLACSLILSSHYSSWSCSDTEICLQNFTRIFIINLELSGFFIYWLGSSAWIIVFFCILAGARRYAFNDAVGFALLGVSNAALRAYSYVDLYPWSMPGGALGSILRRLGSYAFGIIFIEQSIWLGLLSVALALILRPSWLTPVCCCLRVPVLGLWQAWERCRYKNYWSAAGRLFVNHFYQKNKRELFLERLVREVTSTAQNADLS